MKTYGFSFLIFMIVAGLPNFAFPNEKISHAQTIQVDESLRKAEELIRRLSPGVQINALQSIEIALFTAQKGLDGTIVPLLKAKMGPGTGKESHAKELGFDTDIDRAVVRQTAFPIFEVSLNDLRHFAPDTQVTNLLTYTYQLLFPVEVDERVKSSITVRFVPDTSDEGEMEKTEKQTGWRLARWGLPNLIRKLTAQLPSGQQGFLLVIPALNRYFLGYTDNSDLKLIPLASDRPFQEGKSWSTKEVFLRLASEAENVDDRPR